MDAAADARFAELRSLLHRAPSANAWQLACALIDSMSGPLLDEVALPYASAHTTRWPAHLCRAPKLWMERALAGQHEPRLAIVRALIAHIDLDAAQGATLARTTAHAPIQALQLTIGRVDDAALLALLDAPWGASLSALVLRGTQVGAEGLRALLERDHLRSLHTLDLSRSPIEPLRWHLLAQHADRLPSLAVFAAREAQIGDDAFAQLAESGALRHAARLYLTANRLSARAIEALAAHAPSLSTLVFDKNTLRDADAALFSAVRLPALQHLDVSGCDLSRKAMSALSSRYSAPGWDGH